MNLRQVRKYAASLGATMTPDQYAELTGIGRTRTYKELRAGTFPVQVIRQGRFWYIPTAPVLRMLGLED